MAEAMTTYLYFAAGIFALDAVIEFLSITGPDRTLTSRTWSGFVGGVYVGMAWAAVHYAAGL